MAGAGVSTKTAELIVDNVVRKAVQNAAAETVMQGANSGLNKYLLGELVANGVKFTPENVVAVARNPSGKVVVLETGNSKAGLMHIIEEHAKQFAQMGVSEA